MRYAVNSMQMKMIDDYTVQVHHTSALELMERAAEAVAAVVMKQADKADRILVICGPGNNGGDGVAAGRLLFIQGYHVAILFVGEEGKTSKAMEIQLEKAKKLGVPIDNTNKPHEYNESMVRRGITEMVSGHEVLIDALFGVGLSRDVTGEYEAVINIMNNSKKTVYAVDIPSGISADSGKVMNAAVRADVTITFGYRKQGLLLYPGAEHAGRIIAADIGFPETAALQADPDTFYYGEEDLDRLPVRREYSNKGTYGKVLVIAGSKGMSGAAYLAAKAAYRTGAGLVKILTSEANRIILQTSLPEALFSAYDEGADSEERLQKLQENLDWASVIVIGPGLGGSAIAEELTDTVIKYAGVPLIIDADGLGLVAKELSRRSKDDGIIPAGQFPADTVPDGVAEDKVNKRIVLLSEYLKADTILTPHLKELSGLLKMTLPEITDNLIDTARRCTYNNKLIYVIKDARTIVAQQKSRYINVSGNHGMATGGSGDVLTGIIAGLIAQGMKPYEAACLAVYIHGRAGDAAARRKGTYSMMAGDIVDSIEEVLPKQQI